MPPIKFIRMARQIEVVDFPPLAQYPSWLVVTVIHATCSLDRFLRVFGCYRQRQVLRVAVSAARGMDAIAM